MLQGQTQLALAKRLTILLLVMPLLPMPMLRPLHLASWNTATANVILLH